MRISESETKRCPFCSEIIKAEAVKCRFCGEFLNIKQAKALGADAKLSSQSPQSGVLYAGRPSLWALAGAVIKGLIVLVVAACLLVFPLENPAAELLKLTDSQALAVGKYRVVVGLGLAVLVVLILLAKMIWLKSISYKVTADRIEWSRGIFERKVDNLDMFRVIDLRLHRSILDCILGVGTVGLITTDKTDPEFAFEKIHKPRQLYDIIKKVSLEADRQRGVIHLE